MRYAPLFASLVISLSLPACTSDEGGDTDTDAGSSSSSSSTGVTAGPTTSPTATSGSSTSSGEDESSSGTTDEGTSSSSGGGDETTTGGEATDICVGYSLLGMSAQGFTNEMAGEPTCDTTPAPCGGELVGEWTAQTACGHEVLPNFFTEICADATQQITGSSLDGTRTLSDDGTYVDAFTLQFEADLQVDSMACVGLDCVAFGDALSDEPGLEMVCESAGGTDCNCFYTADIPQNVEGTWDIFNDQLLLTTNDNEVIGAFDYCVQDGQLTTWVPLFEGTPFPEVSCIEDDDCEGQVEGEFDGVGCEPPEDEER